MLHFIQRQRLLYTQQQYSVSQKKTLAQSSVVFNARCCAERGCATVYRLSVCLSVRDVEV